LIKVNVLYRSVIPAHSAASASERLSVLLFEEGF